MTLRFFPRLRGHGAATALETKSFGSARTLTSRGWYSTHGPNRADGWDMEAVIAEGFERSVWTYRCVELMSGSASRLPFRLARFFDTEDQEVITDHPLYRVLNRQANPLEDGRAFRKRLSAQTLLSKKGAFVEVTKSRAGTITRLDLLDPDRVEIVPSDRGDYIDFFQYTRRDGLVEELAPERVRWVREPHPTDPFCGTTPLEAAGISIELDQLARLYNVNFIKNDARPGGVLSVDTNTMTDQEMARLESRFKPGAQAAGLLSVIAAGQGGLNYVDTTTRPRDMAYGETSKSAKEEILAAFGIGESVLSNASGRSFDNADQEEYNFWTKPMPPHMDLVASAFAQDVDAELTPFLDTSKVEALEAGERRHRSEAREEFDKGLRSIDEYRPLAKLEPLNLPQSRAVWLTPNKTPIPGDPRDAQALLGGEAVGGEAGAVDPAAAGGPPAGDVFGAEPEATATVDATTAAAVVDEARTFQPDTDFGLPTGEAAHAVDEARAAQDDTLLQPGAAAAAVDEARSASLLPQTLAPQAPAGEATALVDRLRDLEGKAAPMSDDGLEYEPATALSDAAGLAISAALTALLARQVPVIAARLESPKTRKGTPFWRAESPTDTRGGEAPLDVDKVVDVDRWTTECAETLAPVVQDAAIEASTRFLAFLIAEGVFEAVPADRVRQIAGELTKAVTLGVLSLVLDALVEHLRALESVLDAKQLATDDVADLVDAVRDHYAAASWPRMVAGDAGHMIAVAATEHTAAGLRRADGGAGLVVREWVSRRDDRVRDTHVAVDGHELPVGERFTVGTDRLLFPTDPAGSPAETYGCRCRLRYAVVRDGPPYTVDV